MQRFLLSLYLSLHLYPSLMKACFQHWIEKKVIDFFISQYFFVKEQLTILSLHLTVLTFFSELHDRNSQF